MIRLAKIIAPAYAADMLNYMANSMKHHENISPKSFEFGISLILTALEMRYIYCLDGLYQITRKLYSH